MTKTNVQTDKNTCTDQRVVGYGPENETDQLEHISYPEGQRRMYVYMYVYSHDRRIHRLIMTKTHAQTDKTHAQTNGLLATAQRTRPINLNTPRIQQVEDTWMYRCMYMYTCVYGSMYVRMIAGYID